MFDRRSLLKAALATAVLPVLKLKALAAKTPRKFIDVHCHFFNAADLPVRGFLQRVVLSDYNATQADLVEAISLGVWKGLAANLTDVVLRSQAPTIEQELACLKNPSVCPEFGAPATAPSASGPVYAARTRGLNKAPASDSPASPGNSEGAVSRGKLIADALKASYSMGSLEIRGPETGHTRGLQHNAGAPAEPSAAGAPPAGDTVAPGAPPPAVPAPADQASAPMPAPQVATAPAGSAEDTDAFVKYVLQEMQKKGRAPAGATRSLRGSGSAFADTVEAIGNFLAGGSSVFSRYFAWVELLTSYRETIIETYYSLYDPRQTRIILTAPAIVDYNYWLDDQSASPLRAQVELMSRLSLRQKRPMHGYVAFDPLREVKRKPGRPSALSLVQEAVMKRGFLGVKLYSPMGFKPTGNAEKNMTFPAFALQNDQSLGVALDKALDELYAWCDANEVPILAHTTDSQSAGPDYAGRAEPKFWERVVKKYPNLRLNLAHFGNFSQAIGESGATKPYEKTWEYEIASYIKGGRYPNVYTDISFFSWVLDGATAKDQVAVVKKFFHKYFEADPKCERLMYGTDWNMTARKTGVAEYAGSIEVFFRDLGLNEAQLDNLFYKNALRYLGLGEPGMATDRLKAFYTTAGKPYPAYL